MNRCQFLEEFSTVKTLAYEVEKTLALEQKAKYPAAKYDEVARLLGELDALRAAAQEMITGCISTGELPTKACGERSCIHCYVEPPLQTGEALELVEEYNQGGPLAHWLSFGHRGASSNSIVQHLTTLPSLTDSFGNLGRISHPHDSADFRLCRLLLEQVPALTPLLPRMATASPMWGRLVPSWGDLCTIHDTEAPAWRDDSAPCPLTTAMLKKIEASCP